VLDVNEFILDPKNALLLRALFKLCYIPLDAVQFVQHEVGKDAPQSSEVHSTVRGDEPDREAARAAAARYAEVEMFKERMPEGWKVLAQSSAYGGTAEKVDRNNQIVVFSSDVMGLDAIVIKGSSNSQNFISAFLNDGASEWWRVRKNLSNILAKLDLLDAERGQPHARILMGHSLGGGLAQICAILHGMSAYVLNSLPIPWWTVQLEKWNGERGLRAFENKVAKWLAGNTLVLIDVEHDVARSYYHGVKHGYYVNTHVLQLPDHVLPSPHQSVASSIETETEATPLSVVKDALRIPEAFARYACYGLQQYLPHRIVARAVDAHHSTAINVIRDLDKRGKLPPILARQSTFLTQLNPPPRPALQPRQLEQPVSPVQEAARRRQSAVESLYAPPLRRRPEMENPRSPTQTENEPGPSRGQSPSPGH
jgi:pimeloyl-ACP methyl ester carboxylesterase